MLQRISQGPGQPADIAAPRPWFGSLAEREQSSPPGGKGANRDAGATYAEAVSDDGSRPSRAEDVHELALAMPYVTVEYGTSDNPVYQVGRKSFIFFRNRRPDAVDPDTGERYPDVIVFWVASEADKQALVRDEASPFFTTAHFDGHLSVLLRASRIGELTRQELAEVVQDAWLSRASPRRAAAWLSAHPPA
jgi:hypothetical protein